MWCSQGLRAGSRRGGTQMRRWRQKSTETGRRGEWKALSFQIKVRSKVGVQGKADDDTGDLISNTAPVLCSPLSGYLSFLSFSVRVCVNTQIEIVCLTCCLFTLRYHAPGSKRLLFLPPLALQIPSVFKKSNNFVQAWGVTCILMYSK